MKALKMIMSTNSSVSRSLRPVSGGDDHVAEGFNNDIARNGRNFGRQNSTRA